jgi:hypothetical protein
MSFMAPNWFKPSVAAGLVLGATLGGALAQGIYTCTDAKGRKLTSDRPIAECIDREQIELNPSGTVRRRLGPTLTAQERATEEAQQQEAAEERARLVEEKRRDHAMLIRYPSRSVHDTERGEALSQIDEVIKAAKKRLGELHQQGQVIESEMEFYKKDPSRAPPSLKRQTNENEQSISVQNQFIVEQEVEKKRVNARFDEELVKLQKFWALSGATNFSPSRLGASKPAR